MATIEVPWDTVEQLDISDIDGLTIVTSEWRSLWLRLWNRDAFVRDVADIGFEIHTNPNFRGRTIAVRPGCEPRWR